jgi:hypothetical protein
MEFRYQPTVADMTVVTRAGLDRMAAMAPGQHDGLTFIRRLGTAAVAAGVLLLLAGLALLARLIPQLVGTAGWVHIALIALGTGLISLGWSARRLKLDVDRIMGQALGDPGLESNPQVLRAVQEMGEVQVEISTSGVSIASKRESGTYPWTEITSIRVEGETLLFQGDGLSGAMIVLPVRALPQGTNVEAFVAALHQLRAGRPVPGFE